MSRLPVVVAAAVCVALAPGCAAPNAGEGGSQEPRPAPDRTPSEEAAGEPDTWLLPREEPAGLHIAEITPAYDPRSSTLTVYAEPGRDDPAAGRVLGGIFEPASEDVFALPACHGENSREITVNGAPGTVATAGGTHWVCWEDERTDVPDMSPGEFAVIGRRVPLEAVRRAAEEATVGADNMVTVPAGARPPGLEQLARGHASLAGFRAPVFDSDRMIRWTNERTGRELRLLLGDGDREAGLLARVAVGGTPTTVRGRPAGLSSTPHLWDLELTWRESGLLVQVRANGVGRAEVRRFVEGLSLRSDDRLEELRDRIPLYPARDLVGPKERLVLAGHDDHAVWVVSDQANERPLVEGLHVDGGEFGGRRLPERRPGRVITHNGVRSEAGMLVIGQVHPEVARVAMVLKTGRTINLPIGGALADGGRLVGTWLEAPTRWSRMIAYDAEGHVAGRDSP